MISAPIHNTQWVPLSPLKSPINSTPASSPSVVHMINLKRRRESPPSASEASLSPNISLSSSLTLSAYSAFDYPSTPQSIPTPGPPGHIIPRATKRLRTMSSQLPFHVTTASELSYGGYATTTGPYTTNILSPCSSSYTTAGPGPLYAPTSITSSIMTSPAYASSTSRAMNEPAYNVCSPYQSNLPSRPGNIEIGVLSNVKEEQKDRRRSQNREAQRRFRDKKKKNSEDLESENTTLKKDLASKSSELERYKKENEQLRRQIRSIRSNEGVSSAYYAGNP